MTSSLSQIASNTVVLKSLQMTTVASLAILSGIATSLYVWVIPVILRARDTRTKITQFNLVIEKGFQYLQPSSRALGASLASLAVLFYCHPDSAIASRWRYHALAMAILVPTAPYEEYAIFPTNYRVADMGKELDTMRSPDFGDKRDKEVDELLKKWRRRHVGRIVAPVGALLVSIWSVVAEQSF